ncbi:hypothetical protein L1987_02038 [Smallanthus sonchifolius]|uniref:Uncharacterized protein n=1 Tax=Smallanthus sonchifolius TaxID=185202 RepID=A0ACB9K6R5_9ASTR|nr:hypothetical protein L1987_02038 [Smallanthus sonchifolius]
MSTAYKGKSKAKPSAARVSIADKAKSKAKPSAAKNVATPAKPSAAESTVDKPETSVAKSTADNATDPSSLTSDISMEDMFPLEVTQREDPLLDKEMCPTKE